MITKKKFIEIIGSRFWKHINKETELPYFDNFKEKRENYLGKLFEKIERMEYSPSQPRGYIVAHKENLVARFIPALTRDDYFVYFYCIKSIEKEIAKNRVKGTFGGWKLGGEIRKTEDIEDLPSTPDNSFNKFGWKQAWTQYQNKAYRFYNKNPHFKYFFVFDIANFYDSIRLDRLETKIREIVDKNKTQEVNLLFHFLTLWNKKYLNYERQNVGLPQDEVGDCSRILANFYLQEYDAFMFKLVNKNKSGYLRYADDQIISASSEEAARKIMFLASKELAKIGLNLNAKKVKMFDREEYCKYWSFEIFFLLKDPNNVENIKKSYKFLEKNMQNKINFRHDAVLKRILNCNVNKVKSIKKSIIQMVMGEQFLTKANSYYLGKIYFLYDKKEKDDFLNHLIGLSDRLLFNQFHLRVLKFAKENQIQEAKIKQVKINLEKLNKL